MSDDILIGSEVIPILSSQRVTMTETVDQIVQQIEATFAQTPYPGDNNIGSEGIEDGLRGIHWRDLSLETIFRERGDLSFLTSDALRFYLPAFMRAVLLQYEHVDTLSGNLIVLLSPPEQKGQSNFIRRFQSFSKNEGKAIFAFLESYLELNRYEGWSDNTVYRPLLDRAIVYWKQVSHAGAM